MSLIRRFLVGAAGAATASALLLCSQPAAAQDTNLPEGRVTVTGKGITGGILLGAEVGLITVGAIGVKEWWAYLLAGAVGAGGGAVGGYFVEKADPPSEPSLYMLAGGMALIIPTVVIIANATAYDPSEDEEEGEEASDGDEDGTATQVETAWRRPALSLIDMSLASGAPRLRPGVPALSVSPLFTPQEVATYGVKQGAVVHVPLVSGAF